MLRNLCFNTKKELFLIISANSLVTYSNFDLPISLNSADKNVDI